MNRFKAWIKRPVNFNMASLLLVAAIMLIFAAICFGIYFGGEEELNSLKTDINRLRSQEEIGDVAGYGLIVVSIGYGVGVIGSIIFLSFMVLVPLFISIGIIILSVVARILYSNSSRKRLLAYRIVSGIGYFFMLAGCLLCSSIYFYASAIASAVFDLLVIAVFVIGVKNTYSEKIKYGEYLHEKKTNEND